MTWSWLDTYTMAGLSRKGMLAFSSNYFLCSFLVNICSGSFCCCSFVPKSSHSEHLPCFSSTAPRMKHEMLGKMWPEQHRRLLALADDACRTFLRGRRSAGGTLAITVVPVTLARPPRDWQNRHHAKLLHEQARTLYDTALVNKPMGFHVFPSQAASLWMI